jgi:hypothetical protein
MGWLRLPILTDISPPILGQIHRNNTIESRREILYTENNDYFQSVSILRLLSLTRIDVVAH